MGSGTGLLERLRSSWRVALKEVSAFGVVGGSTFVLDLVLYQLCYAGLGLGALTSKVVSTAVTATVAFLAHRYWSFSHRRRPGLRREYPAFVVLNVVALIISLAIIGVARYVLGRTDVYELQAANLVSIAVATLFRFFAYKRWVFPSHDGRAAAERTDRDQDMGAAA